jgi:lysophospholipase L1-like esterase
MKPWFKVVLVSIVFIECSVIAYFGYSLYLRKKIGKNVLSAVTVVPIRNEYLISSPSAELLYFYEPAPNMVEEDQPSWLPYKAVCSINADTLNDRYNYSVEKPPSTFRIITLGDSFTFGVYVNTGDNWTELLEDMLNAHCKTKDIQNIEVINLGVVGYDVQYIARRYKIRGVKYHPDLIIYLESSSGFERLMDLYEPLIKKYKQSLTQEEKSEARQKNDYSLAWTKTQEEISRRYSQEQIFEQVHAAWQDFFQIKGLTKVVIGTFSNISSQDKSKLKVWTAGQPKVNLYFGIRDIYTNDGALPDGHPNKHGHAMIAEDIFTYLKNNGIVTCGK